MVCDICAEESELKCGCGGTLVKDQIFGSHARMAAEQLSEPQFRQQHIVAPRQPLTDLNKRQIERIEKRIKFQFQDPTQFINEHLHRLLHPAIVIEVAELAPEPLLDAMLTMGHEFYLAHKEDRTYSFEFRRHGLWDVIDSVDLDPGSDFGLSLIRLWLHRQSYPK